MVFNKLEGDAMINARKEELHSYNECVVKILQQETYIHGHSPNRTAVDIVHCWYKEPDERSKWSYVTATLYGFGIVTTLGYNRIAPITIPGRLFCVFYGLCGIPITMIIIANFGQYLNQFAGTTRRNVGITSLLQLNKFSSKPIKNVEDAQKLQLLVMICQNLR
uniref:Potassium channel domain-containing protein n=1 Tax=Acrobeloides nanus TaxID=290746 RepID=A0A914C8S1_9BILA